jgi:hypothetical protein
MEKEKRYLLASFVSTIMILGILAFIIIASSILSRDGANKIRTYESKNITEFISRRLKGEDMERYLYTLEEDESYKQTLEFLLDCTRNPRVRCIYVIKFEEDGQHSIFDTEEDPWELGYVDEWNVEFSEEDKKNFYEGNYIVPKIYNSKLYGKTFTMFSPIYYSDNTVAKGYYVAADFKF